jgi:hypothetical protein
MQIKALSIWQPHAHYIISGHKRYETRPGTFRGGNHRGLLAIHASKQWSEAEKQKAASLSRLYPEIPLVTNPPLGTVLGICRMVGCVKTESISNDISYHEMAVGGWEDGRLALDLQVLEMFDTPIRVNGQQGLYDWEFPQEILAKRIAIVGSRDYKDLDAVRRYVYSLPRDMTIVSGGARGVDTVAVETAKERGMRTVVIPVNERGLPEDGVERNRLFAQRAMIRNGEIVQVSGSVVAFWDEKSPGTKNTIERAEKAGIPVIINPNVETEATQMRLIGFGGAAYDEIALIERGKVGHGLPEKKEEEPPFEWSAPWLTDCDDVWVWDGWKEGKRTFKLVPRDSQEAEKQSRFLRGFFYNSNTQELRQWLAEQGGLKPVEGYVADIADMNSFYMVRDGATVENVPVEKLVLTQQTYLPGVLQRYLENSTITDANNRLAYGARFGDSDNVYVLDGTHRTLLARIKKFGYLRMEIREFEESFAQACGLMVADEELDDEEAKLEFYADVLREAINIIQIAKEQDLEPELIPV